MGRQPVVITEKAQANRDNVKVWYEKHKRELTTKRRIEGMISYVKKTSDISGRSYEELLEILMKSLE